MMHLVDVFLVVAAVAGAGAWLFKHVFVDATPPPCHPTRTQAGAIGPDVILGNAFKRSLRRAQRRRQRTVQK